MRATDHGPRTPGVTSKFACSAATTVARAIQLYWRSMTPLKQCEKRRKAIGFQPSAISQAFLPKADSRKLPMTRILCLWFPNWPIQRAIRRRPELKGRAVALMAAESRAKAAPGSATVQTIVAVCCGSAVKQGVRPGMPLAEAQALARDLKVAV